jgi:alginate O-acetyltransferase complex protein AlgJ
MQMKIIGRRFSLFTILLFLGLIVIPWTNDLFHFYRASNLSLTENRLLAKKPPLLFSFLDPYPAAYEQFYNDHFVFREQFLRVYTQLILHGFERSPVPAAVDLGKDGWYFNSRRDKQIYQGKQNLSSEKVL